MQVVKDVLSKKKKNKLQNGFLNVCAGAGLFTIMCTYISGKLIKSFQK